MNYPKYFHCGNVVVTKIEGKTDLFLSLADEGDLEKRTRFLLTILQDMLSKETITENVVHIILDSVNRVKNKFGEKVHTRSEMSLDSKNVDSKSTLFSILGLMRNIGLSKMNNQKIPKDLDEMTETNILDGLHLLFDNFDNPKFNVSPKIKIFFCKGDCPDTILSDYNKMVMKKCSCQKYFQKLFQIYGRENLEILCPDYLLYLLSLFVNHTNPKYIQYCVGVGKMDMNNFIEFNLKEAFLSINPNEATLESLFILLSSIITFMPLDYAFITNKGLTNIFCNMMMSALHLSIFNFVDIVSDLPAIETDDMNDVMTAYNYYFTLKSIMEYFVEANRISERMINLRDDRAMLDCKMEFIKYISCIYSISDTVDTNELKKLLQNKNTRYYPYGWVDYTGRIINKFRLNSQFRHKHIIKTNTLHICEIIWPELQHFNTAIRTTIKSKSKLTQEDYKYIIWNNFLGLMASNLCDNANIKNTHVNEKLSNFWNLARFSQDAVNEKEIQKGHLSTVWNGMMIDGTHFNLLTTFSYHHVIGVSKIELLLFEQLLGGDFSQESINYIKQFFIRLLISNMCIMKQFFTNFDIFKHIFVNQNMECNTDLKIKTERKMIEKILREKVEISLKHMNLIEPNISAIINDIEIMVNSQSEIGIMLKLAKSLNTNMVSCKDSIIDISNY